MPTKQPPRQTPTENVTPPTPPPPSPQQAWLTARIDRAITARLLDGKGISGTLLSFDQYCLLIRTADGRAVLVYKHAVAYLSERAQ